TARFFSGDLAELLIFEGALSTANREAIESYLTQKWFTSALDFANLFEGYIDRIVPNPERGEEDAYVYATDEMNKFNQDTNIILLTDYTEAQILGFLSILTALAKETITDPGVDLYPWFWLQNENNLAKANQIAKSSAGLFYSDQFGVMRYENRAHRGKYHATPEYHFDNTHHRLKYDYGSRELANRIITKWHYREKAAALSDLWTLGNVPLILGMETAVYWAVFSNPADDVVNPVASTDFTANSQADGLGVDMTFYMTVTPVIYGATVKLTVANIGSSEFYVTLLKVRGKTITEVSKGEAVSEGAVSIAIYGQITNNFDALYLSDPELAQGRSDLLLSRKKDPVTELGLVLRPASDAMLTQMLSREISDCIRITDDLAGIISDDYHIEKITHRILPEIHETEWYLTFFADAFDYWILGTSALGTGTRLA
ncbi:MAG: hypothetical protein Q8P44_00550, partial [Dehalococcoidia bacterium]|nr:hypothetical protein [Dehalococcoidia bacterium]